MLFDGILKTSTNYQTNNNYRKIHIRKINRMRSTIERKKQRVNKQCSKFSTHRQKIKEKTKSKNHKISNRIESENLVTELFETDLI